MADAGVKNEFNKLADSKWLTFGYKLYKNMT